MIIEKRNADGQITGVYWDGVQWKDKPVREETRAFIEEYKQLYADDIKAGKKKVPDYLSTYGEFFVIRYERVLLTHDHWGLTKVIDFIEGKDGKSFNIFGRNGNVEVKAIRNHLTRDDLWMEQYKVDHELSGSVQFEIFHDWQSTTAEERYQGWLWSEYNYEQYNAVKQQHGRPETAETPDTLAFILMKANKEPFACIAFEDIRALLTRLYKILPMKEWDIDNIGIPPATDAEYWKKYIRAGRQQPAWSADRGGMIQNMWHVPFRLLADLATVTMIGEVNPAEELQVARFKCPESVAQQRLTFLQDLAAQQGRRRFKDPDAFTKWETEHIARLTEKYGDKFKQRNYTHDVLGQMLEMLTGDNQR